MMKALRKNYKIILWILAIMIIPPFIWWGAGTYLGEKKKEFPTDAGFIGKSKVTLNEYRVVYTSLAQSLRNLFSGQSSEELLRELTWIRLLLLHEAKNQGIKVSDQEVRERIAQLPHFQKEGHFDPVSYQKAFGGGARFFEENVRQELILDKLRNSVTANVQVQEEEVRSEYWKKKEKIQLAYTLIPIPQQQQETNPPSESAPTLNTNTAQESIQIREQTHQQANQHHQELTKKLEEGLSPSEAFSQIGLDVVHSDPITRNDIFPQLGYQPAFLNTAFETPEGSLGPVVELVNGFCLYWVEKKITPEEAEFQKEKQEYSLLLLEKKKSDTFNQWVSELQKTVPIKSALPDIQN